MLYLQVEWLLLENFGVVVVSFPVCDSSGSPRSIINCWSNCLEKPSLKWHDCNNDHYFFLGHNWFGDEWPSLGLTEEEFLAEYSKTLDKLADTHTR